MVLSLFSGTALADAGSSASPSYCDQVHSLVVALDSGVYWVKTEGIVEALPEYAAEHLSDLTWRAGSGFIGLNVSYRPWRIIRINGGLWYLTDTRSGQLINLYYLDSSSDEVTHRSLSASDFGGVGWQVSIDFLAWSTSTVICSSSLLHAWVSRQLPFWGRPRGEYEYPDRRVSFDDDEHFVRYLILHQVFDVGVFVKLGHAKDGFYGRMRGAVFCCVLVDDRDTHIVRDTDYYNTYRLGWYVRPEIAAGFGLGKRIAVEAFYEPEFQFGFEDARTTIRTPYMVRDAAENPNYIMALHPLGFALFGRYLGDSLDPDRYHGHSPNGTGVRLECCRDGGWTPCRGCRRTRA